MADGYLYCFSNDSMPGILKIGMTERTPEIRLKEANSSDTWRPPTPYKINFAKKVYNVKQKEKTLHMLLTQYTERINPNREFFRISSEEIMKFFELIDGDLWIEDIKKNDNDDDDNDDNDDDDNDDDDDDDDDDNNITNNKIIAELEHNKEILPKQVKKCRDMSKCFTNGQKIKHTIGINKTWIGIYNSLKNEIICNEKIYKGKSPLNQFVKSHYKTERNDRTSNANAWKECECEINEKWISTYNL